MYYIGLMSGTSMDAIDVALVEFNKKTILKKYREYPIEHSLKKQIRMISKKSNFIDVVKLDNKLGHIFANAVNNLLKESRISADEIVAIGSHGQTVLHAPEPSYKTSIQISDPNVICAETGITTVSDFRRMDIAFGGQGAPLASAFHEYQFKNENKSLVVLNIGGFANITLLPNYENKVIGFDTGPGNSLLDDWIKQNKNKEYDKDGLWAGSGEEDEQLLEEFLKDNYFSQAIPKSTGREHFNLDWLKKILKNLDKELSAENIQATLLKLSSITISDAIKKYANGFSEIIVCGGGANNPLLIKNIKELLIDFKITSTSDYGLPPDCIEAVTFAWLAKKRLDNESGNIPTVTGANKNVILGGIYSPKN